MFGSSQLNAALVVWLHSQNSGCIVYSAGLKVRIDSNNCTLVSDLFVLCDPAEHSAVDPQAITNPTVIVDVLLPGEHDCDRGSKLFYYLRVASLREYVIVAQSRRSVTVCRRVGELWGFEDIDADGVLKLESLGFELPLERLYCDANGVIVDPAT